MPPPCRAYEHVAQRTASVWGRAINPSRPRTIQLNVQRSAFSFLYSTFSVYHTPSPCTCVPADSRRRLCENENAKMTRSQKPHREVRGHVLTLQPAESTVHFLFRLHWERGCRIRYTIYRSISHTIPPAALCVRAVLLVMTPQAKPNVSPPTANYPYSSCTADLDWRPVPYLSIKCLAAIAEFSVERF